MKTKIICVSSENARKKRRKSHQVVEVTNEFPKNEKLFPVKIIRAIFVRKLVFFH